jgi:hypothetical protein
VTESPNVNGDDRAALLLSSARRGKGFPWHTGREQEDLILLSGAEAELAKLQAN